MSLDPKIPKTGWNTTATKTKGQEATKATKAKTTKAKGQVAKEPHMRLMIRFKSDKCDMRV